MMLCSLLLPVPCPQLCATNWKPTANVLAEIQIQKCRANTFDRKRVSVSVGLGRAEAWGGSAKTTAPRVGGGWWCEPCQRLLRLNKPMSI
eukprot:263079-Alexandrium_andersonii.AAC.1